MKNINNIIDINDIDANINNSSTYEDQSLEGISFIEKAEHNINDLEDSISQYLLLLTKQKSEILNLSDINTRIFSPIKKKDEKTENLSFKLKKQSKKSQIKEEKQPKKSQIKEEENIKQVNTITNIDNLSNSNKKIFKGLKLKPKRKIKITKSLVNKKNKQKLCSILKSSKKNIKNMKFRLSNIFENKTKMIDDLVAINAKNFSELNQTFQDAQIDFENKMEQLYNEKLNKLNLVNKEYDEEIFRFKKLFKKENNNSDVINTDLKNKTIVQEILEELINEKQQKIQKIENEFKKEKDEIFSDYREPTESFGDFTAEERCLIYKSELIDNIKNQISQIVTPEKCKKVKFNDIPIFRDDRKRRKKLIEKFGD